MTTKPTAFIALLLALFFPVSQSWAFQGGADANAGAHTTTMLYSAGGSAKINGAPGSESSALADGDIVDTGASPVTVTRKGSTVTAKPNSKFAVSDNNFHLACGDATVKTTSGLSTLTQGYGVTPAGVSGRYEVLQAPDHMQVMSLEGDTWVYAGSKQLTVPQGQMLSLPGECMDDAALKSAAPALPSGPAAPAHYEYVPPARLSSTSLIITAGVLGGLLGGGGAIAWWELEGKPVSPSKP